MAVGCGNGGANDVIDGGDSVATSVTTAPSTDGTSVPPTSQPPSVDGWDVIVSASGRGGLIDSIGVSGLDIVGGSGSAEPWLRFDLELQYCCGEANSIEFTADQWSVDVDGVDLAVVGPLCVAPVECDDQVRSVTLVPFEGATVTYEVFRDSTVAPDSAGTFTTQIAPVFHWIGDVIDPEPIPIEVRLDISEARQDPSGDSTPTETEHSAVTVIGGGLHLIEYPYAGVADDIDELAALFEGSARPIDIEELAVDWESQVALVLSIGDDLCPRVLVAIDVTDAVARPVFTEPGYLSCEDPLVSYTVIAAVDRSVLADASSLELSAELASADVDTTISVDVTPSAAALTVSPVDVSFGEPSGEAPLPARGEVRTATLRDGTPVFVVHHHDGTVSALDPRGADQNVDGLFQTVHWVAATRNFLGRGAWDEYGRRLDGFRTSDLVGFATRVSDGVVEIGSAVSAPAGSPIAITGGPPAMADQSIEPASPLSLEQAMALPPGSTAWIDAVVSSMPDAARVCAFDDRVDERPDCHEGSPTADGVTSEPGWSATYFGPLLATRAPDGFERIAFSGGYGGTSL